MRIQVVMFLVIVFGLGVANARGPAVEDFVGVEMEGPDSPPQGTEGLFNFDKEMKDFSGKPNTTQQEALSASSKSNDPNFLAYAGYGLILLLPLISWMLVLNHLKSQEQMSRKDNLQVLENYRKEKEKEKKQEEIKKAS